MNRFDIVVKHILKRNARAVWLARAGEGVVNELQIRNALGFRLLPEHADLNPHILIHLIARGGMRVTRISITLAFI